MVNSLPLLIILCIWGGSFATASLPLAFAISLQSFWGTVGAIACMPLIFITTFVTIAGSLSRMAQHAIVPGTFPRKNFDKIYFWRRVYGTCWTQLYYFKPIYSVCLAIPFMKKYTLRVYGYRGPSTSFVVYPDTWIRDLPVLDIADKAYLSNKSTIGTNICLSDGNILVDKVTIRESGLIGHMAMIAPGTVIEENAEVGVGCSISIRSVIKKRATLKPNVMIGHGVVVGERVEVGAFSHVGMRSRIGEGVKIPAGSNIPAGAVILNQADLDAKIQDEATSLAAQLRHQAMMHLVPQAARQ